MFLKLLFLAVFSFFSTTNTCGEFFKPSEDSRCWQHTVNTFCNSHVPDEEDPNQKNINSESERLSGKKPESRTMDAGNKSNNGSPISHSDDQSIYWVTFYLNLIKNKIRK